MDGPDVALVFPGEPTARKWTGALEARLRRGPLEQFLLSSSLKVAKAGAAQASDNMTRATVFIVQAGLQAYFKERDHGLSSAQLAAVGHCACLVSRAASAAIREPATWRVPALVSTALLLSPWIGLNAAASGSAGSVRDFADRLKTFSKIDDNPLSERVAVAVIRNDYTQMTDIAEMISQCLATIDRDHLAPDSASVLTPALARQTLPTETT
jgi:hypothetical protein